MASIVSLTPHVAVDDDRSPIYNASMRHSNTNSCSTAVLPADVGAISPAVNRYATSVSPNCQQNVNQSFESDLGNHTVGYRPVPSPAACVTVPHGLEPSTAPSSNSSGKSWIRHFTKARIQAAIIEHFMLLSFTLAAALAMAWPLPGKVVAGWSVGDIRVVQAVNNFLVFLISGLTLKSDDFRALLQHWLAMVYGLVAILVITPCFGFITLRLPLQPQELATGLTLFCIVPTTLGVGVALTAAAKGNQALALLLTVVTNLLGIVTVPYELRLVLSTVRNSAISVDPGNLVIKLVITVLVPTIIGKVARECSRHIQQFVTDYKTQLSMFSTLNLAFIVWQTLSGARNTILQQPFTSILLVVLASSLLHCIMLVLNGIMVSRYVMKLPFREGVAVLIMSSQKSAPVAVTVITYLTPSLVQQGLMAIPCILGQLAQIFIGSAVVRVLRKRADKGL